MKKLKEILLEHDIAPSLQRIMILEYLIDNRVHPTAEMIYTGLYEKIPTLSKTTVYNTLKTFSEKGIVTPLSFFENEVRYEYYNFPHVHLKCIKCNNIYDIDTKLPILEKKTLEGHQIIEHHINLKGICKNCLNKNVEK